MTVKLTTLKPRLSTLKSTLQQAHQGLQTINSGSWRSGKQKTSERGYGWKWQKAREQWLQQHPMCVMCDELDGRVVAATVVDHKVAHRGDQAFFWDRGNWQSLCKLHHDSHAQRRDNELDRLG